MKIVLLVVIRFILRLLWILPIRKNQCLFLSYNGKQYSDSPLYMYRYLEENNKGLSLIWAFRNTVDVSQMVKAGIRFVRVHTIGFYIALATSKVIISNDGIEAYIPIRRNQVFLNTWHGIGPGKKMRKENVAETKYEKYYWKIHVKQYSAFCSWSRYCSEKILKNSLGFRGDILEIGLPRHQLFVDENMKEHANQNFRKQFGFNQDEVLILYAPTFRGNAANGSFLADNLQINMDLCKKVVEEKTNRKAVMLYRAHHAINYKPCGDYVDMTDYPDIQIILCAADYLITDYSSCMYDAMISGVPTFLYTPDYEVYMRNQEYYSDLRDSPNPIAFDMNELFNNIIAFDEDAYARKVKAYMRDYGFTISKNPVSEVCQYISTKAGWINRQN